MGSLQALGPREPSRQVQLCPGTRFCWMSAPKCSPGQVSAKMATKMFPIPEYTCLSPSRDEVYFPYPWPGLALRLALANEMHWWALGLSSHAEIYCLPADHAAPWSSWTKKSWAALQPNQSQMWQWSHFECASPSELQTHEWARWHHVEQKSCPGDL